MKMNKSNWAWLIGIVVVGSLLLTIGLIGVIAFVEHLASYFYSGGF
jgi:ABC-type phosphate transport system auxiliary subunit